MKITKYEHACLDIDEGEQRLIIDPGKFSNSLTDFSNIYAVVVTHVHPDHLDPEKLVAIIRENPTVVICTVQVVANEIGQGMPVKVVTGGDSANVGNFQLEFFGGQHAIIHQSYPPTDNIGVMINKKVYYPGDSFSLPGQPVSTLAVPASAPWMKVGEAMDFINEIKPGKVFPSHNAILSDIGADIHYRILEMAAKQAKAEFIVLEPGQGLTA